MQDKGLYPDESNFPGFKEDLLEMLKSHLFEWGKANDLELATYVELYELENDRALRHWCMLHSTIQLHRITQLTNAS